MPYLIRRIVAKTWKPTVLLALLTPPAAMAVMFFSVPTFETNFLNELNQPALAVPEPDRAWPLYREALAGLPPLAESEYQRVSYYGRRPIDPEWANTRSFLLEHAETLEKLRAASHRAGLGWVGHFPGGHSAADLAHLKRIAPDYPAPHPSLKYDTPHRDILNGHIQYAPGLDEATDCLQADLWLAAEEMDNERIASNYQALLNVANHGSENGQLWPLISTSHQRVTAHYQAGIIVTTTHAGTSPKLLKRLFDITESTPGPLLDPHRLAVSDNDLIQRLFTANGLPTWTGPWLTDSESFESFYDVSSPSLGARLRVAFESPLTYMTSPRRSAFTRVIRQRNERLRIALDQPSHRPSLGGGGMILGGGNTASGHARRLRDHLALYESGWPIQMVTTRRAEETGIRDALRVTLALHLYHTDHNRWPDTLADLVPNHIDVVPPDPINGGGLRYRIDDGQPLVYSVGSDGDDDGGRPPLIDVNPKYGFTAVRLDELEPDRSYKPHHRAARQWHDSNPADGDWILYPWPTDPPLELPEAYDSDLDPYGGWH